MATGGEEEVGDEFVDLWLDGPRLSRSSHGFVSVVESRSGAERVGHGDGEHGDDRVVVEAMGA
jgi:hypothetical protein